MPYSPSSVSPDTTAQWLPQVRVHDPKRLSFQDCTSQCLGQSRDTGVVSLYNVQSRCSGLIGTDKKVTNFGIKNIGTYFLFQTPISCQELSK
jgi:hypothetical protein